MFNLETLHHALIVSCQPEADEAFYNHRFVTGMAQAALLGGAKGLRLNGPETIRHVRMQVEAPVIGLWKRTYPKSEVYITPTLADAEEILAAGADILALDATSRPRPGGESLAQIVTALKVKDVCLMADISTLEEGKEAERLGFDCISTTLSGYTPYSRQQKEPDFQLLQALKQAVSLPVIMEGRIWTPEQAMVAQELGAYAVVVGSAITRPQLIARRFVARMADPFAEI
ncbi:N-acetylmannosamine-6-phosphate 2-epimerase [bacterium (Candidatus Blackallbacteria) CG17_big_fil_post_rev_8_21_14_2_50_48_46]|uniref:Putative N-acetylmannosamine-6-phosphate 2-epimerase n=1 Tax=bacterium (Candidatus Blackallbacteria) CG17_big_fil_post_rev_8_21_14_2_50_48_46 TaxID=2014261 RepID=A0A2M7FXJ8_9BACT|nr:MAG: N-acetylmannosamine-6-phosphate 2-epimerase [bacterium (Candidatus Blackallbacteria) CG18_big_fil_WC_8_21_14_2_50_49_26]PIW13839.1 MAG: N-acetylmannosamine-6-phosphate 2-epimerase [bacterium (Candidatus Blackallbacteria) CG17_big_fil_post_rev_8_21_14_2_50_48_46]PIW45065.1 MAG: N-acetylmannosamine-6-phosphate 2-epimerase [bacterium (Candidatus Blackallbacteria) CG13_big_fil_rev_8_21_14_2_50_49_14]